MTPEKSGLITQGLMNEVIRISQSKGRAYAGTKDSLVNFKRNAEALGLTKYQVWGVYAGKHYDSIMNCIKANPEFPEELTEGLEGRILDLITYLTILQCLIQEDEEAIQTILEEVS